MRIKEIRIEGLFGLFDHTIPLNMEEGLTIVYGENGIGKTMIFRMLDWIFQGNSKSLSRVNFEKFTIVFNTGISVVLQKDKEGEVKLEQLNKEGKKNHTIPMLNWYINELKEDIDKAIIKLGYLHGDDNDTYFNIEYNEYSESSHVTDLSIKDIIKNNFQTFPKKIKNHLKINQKDFQTHFINTQRLLLFPGSDRYIVASRQYPIKLSKLIQEKHKDYYKLSEQLEASVSKRILNKEVITNYSYEDIERERTLVYKRLSQVQKVGLLTDYQYDKFEIKDDLDDISKAVIAVNIQDFQTKLKVFDELYEKLSLFLDIINNRRFSYKKMYITNEGFKFKNVKGAIIEATQLSSGEQHELILIYRLLFEIPEGSLVLIDEPEISLHVVWQKDFVEDMLEIIKLRNLDILVATHSPSIINGHWDLTVSLKGIEEEAYV